MWETQVQSLGWEDPLEKQMAAHCRTLAWKIPWMEEPGRLQSMGLWRVGHDWATSLSLFTFMHWRRQWQPTPVFLPGESQVRENLVGCSPWGREESDTTERLHFRFSLSCIGEGNSNPLQCSCLENPRDGGAWWAAVYGVAQSWTRPDFTLYGVREFSNFILLHIAGQFSQHHLLKRLSFLLCIFLPPLSNIRCP